MDFMLRFIPFSNQFVVGIGFTWPSFYNLHTKEKCQQVNIMFLCCALNFNWKWKMTNEEYNEYVVEKRNPGTY